MKIGIIGANGKAGRCIIHEADRRGHEVTAIVRNHETILGPGYPIIEKDLFDLTPDYLKPYDVVVSAFGLPFDGKHPDGSYQKAYAHLIEVFRSLPDKRLLVVGGAGTLFTDDTCTQTVLDTMPEGKMRQDPADMAKVYGMLRSSGIPYTFFSPACFFDPKGGRTKQYKLGTDAVIHNDAGESYISYEDYAFAMLDEIEQGNFVGKRFTAVSEKKYRKEPPYYGIRPDEPKYEGMSQFREPLCYDLAGHSYQLVFDNGERDNVDFLTGNTLQWSELGTAGTPEYYECVKGAQGLYFVNFEFACRKPRTNHTFVIDVEERLVTLVKTIADFDEKYPYLVDSENLLGAVDIPGFPLPTKRHRYTTDLVGKRIHWRYRPNWGITHVYYSPDFHRLTFPSDPMGDVPEAEWMDMLNREPYDEKADYIKIKEGLYLFSCMEQNMSKRGQTGNSLVFLIDTRRVHDVGRSFGRSGQFDGEEFLKENYIYGAFGEFAPSDGSVESRPNNYVRAWKTQTKV
ncbi:MAG: NAD(P)H-binding protein [Eubacteriales bacterium]|nr:NAD(P)H-binding protein [Eubacteriales bacterium]